MILTPTVFVLGAGASMPYKFPSGRRLVDLATKAALNDTPEHQTLCHMFGETQVKGFGVALQEAKPPSVDAFLHWQPDFSQIGRAVIAAALIPHEKPDCLLSSPVEDDWLAYFFDRIRGHGPNDFKRNRFSIVTFNFDRVFELALYKMLRTSYQKANASDLLARVPIVHVHGQLGTCEWMSDRNPGDHRPFDPVVTRHAIELCARQIGIVGDQVPLDRMGAVSALLASAERVVFLGFGFDSYNMEWLIDAGYVTRIPAWATGYGVLGGERMAPMKRFNFRLGQFGPADEGTRLFLRRQSFMFDEA